MARVAWRGRVGRTTTARTCVFITHAPLVPELKALAAGAIDFVAVPSTSHGQPVHAAASDGAPAVGDRWPQREVERQWLLAHCPAGSADVLLCNLFCLDALAVAEAHRIPAAVVSPFWQSEPCPPDLEAALRNELPELAAALNAQDVAGGARSGRLGWAVVRHWVWRLFLEDLGEWRERALGLDPFPFVQDLARTGVPPPAPHLIYTLPRCLLPAPWARDLAALTATSPEADAAVVHVVGPLVDGPTPPVQPAIAVPGAPPPTIYMGFGSMEAAGQLDARAAALIVPAIVHAAVAVQVRRGWPAVRVVVHSADAAQAPLADAGDACARANGGREGMAAVVVVRGRVEPDLATWAAASGVAVAVHHGGAGTVTAFARAAVPQVVLPFVFDQADWGAAVAAKGVGAVLPTWTSVGRSSAGLDVALAAALVGAASAEPGALAALALALARECASAAEDASAVIFSTLYSQCL